MKIVLSDAALNWFKEEMEVVPGDAIRFFARYGGASPLHEGFSLGVMKEQPDEVAVETTHGDTLYYVESRDEWYFDGHDLHVNVNPELKELIYSYEKA
ncbi:HesB/YadR/YfhF family protein [Sporosarcina sp. G11-34]|uniref:HesB/YadR/YfhF family protein n=1 Tax=Sporosarcina sp. G11-34 TaxID=2849605 RepID=UPI0022A95B4A|nr:HesB/YadR/YfhF family protein [Sporosarcina sp. G11-34]MCZ2258160.1 HesB/YadR/YfhF family protein [Sporosarcina sp. G11-34]